MTLSRINTIAVLSLATSLAACGPQPDQANTTAAVDKVAAKGRTVRVETRVVQQSEFMDVIELTGDVEAVDDATLSSQTAGTVVYLAPLGSNVPRGHLVARIDPGIADAGVERAEAQVAAAQAQLDLAHDSFRRQEPLYRDSVISALEFENVRAQLSQAEAQVKQARAVLNQAREQSKYTRIAAPFSGRVEQHMVERGEQVTPGMPTARLVNSDRVKVTGGVPERYAGDIRNGTLVRVDFGKYGLGLIEARASFVGSVIDKASRTFPVEIEIQNANGRLKPEMIAKVLVTRDELRDAVVVPISSVLRDENGTNVFVAQAKDGRSVAVRQAVTVGPTYGGQAVILDGLQPGDRLVVAGQTLLTPGDVLDIVVDSGGTSEDTQPAALTSIR